MPGSSTTLAIISMLHNWLAETDGTCSTVRVALLDFKKAFDLVDHNLLITKLISNGIRPRVVNWITDFLRNRRQRAKLGTDNFSSYLEVPAGIPQSTKICSLMFLVTINDLNITGPSPNRMWKFADDTAVSEVISERRKHFTKYCK